MSFAIVFPWCLLVLVLGFGVWLRRRYVAELTARTRSEAALRATEQTLTRMRQAIESASDAIGIGDMDGTSLYHNRAHLALFGYSVEELNALPGAGVLFADAVVAAAIHAAIRHGYSWAGETDIRTKDGRQVPCFVRADLIRDEQGRPSGIFGVFTDITERRRIGRQLDEQRQRLEVTLQSIGDAVITVDPDGRVVLMNPVAEQITGTTQAAAVGQPVSPLLHLHDETTREPRPSSVLDLLRDPRRSRASDTFLFIGAHGEERLLAESAAVIKAADGQAAGAVLALRDVTRERRRSDDVARAGKLESLGLMAGSIAHDFGNLLTAMVANLQLALLAENLPAEAARRLEEVERAVWRARDITQQLTTFAKGGTMIKKPVALAPLLREATHFAAQNTTVQARYQFAPDLWPVEADEGQIVQVINNLAVNAVQAMPDGGRLLVTAENVTPSEDSSAPLHDARWVKITVSDTGTGIPPENLGKIFEPFFTTKPKGTGLGLATCYAIVKKHGGSLRVESAIGRGTAFQILLPAAAGESTTASPFARNHPRQSLGRILVMDDERGMRDTMVLQLGLLDYDAVDAADGDEAIEKFTAARASGQPFDAVLLDARVGAGLGGAETIARMLALDPQVRAIVASGYPDDPVMTGYRTHGFVRAMPKPFKMDDLRVALHEVLNAPP